jgi:hypothetical protein
VVCWCLIIFFLSYYVLEFDEFIFSLQDTYNSRLKERYGDEPSTHLDIGPDLWLEEESFGGPDRNRVYGLFNTMTENL